MSVLWLVSTWFVPVSGTDKWNVFYASKLWHTQWPPSEVSLLTIPSPHVIWPWNENKASHYFRSQLYKFVCWSVHDKQLLRPKSTTHCPTVVFHKANQSKMKSWFLWCCAHPNDIIFSWCVHVFKVFCPLLLTKQVNFFKEPNNTDCDMWCYDELSRPNYKILLYRGKRNLPTVSRCPASQWPLGVTLFFFSVNVVDIHVNLSFK